MELVTLTQMETDTHKNVQTQMETHTITDVHMDIQAHRTEAFTEKKKTDGEKERLRKRKGREWWRRKRSREGKKA